MVLISTTSLTNGPPATGPILPITSTVLETQQCSGKVPTPCNPKDKLLNGQLCNNVRG